MSDHLNEGRVTKPPEGEAQAQVEPVRAWGVWERVIGMFVRPRATFQTLKAHPTWLVALFLLAGSTMVLQLVYITRVPYAMRWEANLEKTIKINRKLGMDPQEEQYLRQEYARQAQRGETSLQKLWQGVVIPLINWLMIVVVGAALYQVGALLARDRLLFKRALAVRAYAEMPPTIVLSLFLIIQMVLSAPEEVVDYKGLVRGNLGILIENPDAHVVLTTIANHLDLFQFWSVGLAALGLSVMLEKAKRWVAVGIAGGVWLLGVLVKIAINSAAGVVIV
ncbi:MAG: YIP1 family protein [Blastocatellia bacterium]|nr:YIP1 family protein [Blastocatellia bacterium]MCS7157394.1 YIP1 family protein [Blastocatellia bacterium]MCX7752568.1 YIP1 family protein [Blastocatellia bacterium]MDW8168299.1 YIP1 family protein [Acidobacteriota bacterium]MDW8255495.1 YIP1 family protein [Acidobacteriota bacterium]